MAETYCGIGSVPCTFAIVGEGWSTLGAKLKQPFTGNAETLLTAILKAAQIPANATFFTNAVNHVPTSGKVTKGAVDLCQEALFMELKEAQPKVILACGSWALYALTGKQTPLAEVRGIPIWVVELQAYVVPTYHPGAISYNPGLFEDFSHDIERFVEAAKMEPGGITYPEPILHVVDSEKTFDAIKNMLSNPQDSIISVDIETDGFAYFTDDILSLGLGPTDDDVVIFDKEFLELESTQKWIDSLFAQTDIEYVYQNGPFDVTFMRAHPDPEVFGKRKKVILPHARCDYDTMLAHYCLDERQGTHGLKVWAKEEFMAPDWESDIGKYLPTKSTPFSAIPRHIMYRYQAYDVFYTRKGRYRFTEKMIEDGVYECFQRVYCPSVEAFTQIRLKGVPIDRERLQQLYEEAQPRIAEASKKLQEAAVEYGWNPHEYAKQKNREKMAAWEKENRNIPVERQSRKPGGTEIPKVFNPRSHPQLSYVAYDLCGLPLFDVGGGEKKKTCNKDAVDVYRHRHPFWNALAEYKEVSDLFGTFIKGMLERTDPDDRIRPDFLLHGTKTGRISCSNPNMQNLPRGSVVKDFFVADEGCVVVNADYKTLEVVIAAVLSDDPEMKKPFVEGLDFHSQTAEGVFEKELVQLNASVEHQSKEGIRKLLEPGMMMEIRHKVEELLEADDFQGARDYIWKHYRFLTKFVTFGIMYGRGALSLAEGELNCSINQATGYMNQFFARYPRYKRWLAEQEQHALQEGYVQNAFGFKRRWPFITNDIKHEIRNQSWNTPVQGSASMVCMMALCRCQEILTAREWGRVLFTVHDSIVYSIKKEYLHEALTYIQAEMTRDVIGTDVRLEAEFEVGPSYMQVKEVILDGSRWIPAHTGDSWLDEVMGVTEVEL